MAYANQPDPRTWQERKSWLQELEASYQQPHASYLLSAHGTFLSRDLDMSFCAGAWAAVIIMAHAIIDTVIRDTDTGNYKSNSFELFGDDEELQWLRRMRNMLVHVKEEASVIDEAELHRIEENYGSLEPEARRAVQLVFQVMYANPGT